ncbi:MAG: hypothetical protein M3354_10740 [Chloroflexota bacterium]|nr:hypothetical protein [Chloroflexota bacterium]
MDSKQFDRWTRALAASPPSRRDLLKTLSGGVLGGLLGLAGLREVVAACRLAGQRCSAASRCCAGSRCRGGRCKCKESDRFFACNGPGTRCVNTRTNEAHCGACGRSCGEHEICLLGGCIDHCQDGLHDVDEGDEDCGGAHCEPCANGKTCNEDADCTSDFCDSDGTCQDFHSCSDEQKNGHETDVDCGGPDCGGCTDGKACFINADCENNFCDRPADSTEAGVCGVKPTCANGKKDGTESDIDCGGSSCPRCEIGQKCNSADDCRGLAFCVNRAGDGSDKKFCVECTTGAALSADDICLALYGDARPTCVNYSCRALDGTCSAGRDACKVITSPENQCASRCGLCKTTTEGAMACVEHVDRCENPCTSSGQCVNRHGPGAVCVKDTGEFCFCSGACALPC